MSVPAEVLIVDDLTPETAAELVDEFASVGLIVEVRQVSARRSFDDVAWYILAALPLKPFLDKLVEDAAADAYGRLKIVVARVLRHRPGPSASTTRVLVLRDTVTGATIVVEPDLPADSYRALAAFDLSTVGRGPLHFDRHQNRWRSELDEAVARPLPGSPPGDPT